MHSKKKTNKRKVPQEVSANERAAKELEDDAEFQGMLMRFNKKVEGDTETIQEGLEFIFGEDAPLRMDDDAVDYLHDLGIVPVHTTVPLTVAVANEFRLLATVPKDRDLKLRRLVDLWIGMSRYKLPFAWSVLLVMGRKGRVLRRIRLDGKHSSWLICMRPDLVWPGEQVTVYEYRIPDTVPEEIVDLIASGLYRHFNTPSSSKTNTEIIRSGATIIDPRIAKANVTDSTMSVVNSTLWAYSQKHNRAHAVPPATKADIFHGYIVDFLLMVSFLTRGARSVDCKTIGVKGCIYMMFYSYRIDPEATLAFWLTVRDGAVPDPSFSGDCPKASPTRRLMSYLEKHHLTTGDVKSNGKAQKKEAVPWDDYIATIRAAWNNWCDGNTPIKQVSKSKMGTDRTTRPKAKAKKIMNRPMMKRLLSLISNGEEKEARKLYEEAVVNVRAIGGVK